MKTTVRVGLMLLLGLALTWACGHDSTLRAYLEKPFWLPFSKTAQHFEKKNVRRISAPFAGMAKAEDKTPVGRLRAAYQFHAPQDPQKDTPESLRAAQAGVIVRQRQALAEAQADGSLTPKDREEVSLMDAKIDIRASDYEEDAPEQALLLSARGKLQAFLKTAKTPEFASEGRGWLAHVYFRLGDRTSAGKIYIDELNHNGSNLSRDTILTSLRVTYGYDGGPDLEKHLEEYFDTPEHAAFAIQLVTNPLWDRPNRFDPFNEASPPKDYARVNELLLKHQSLLGSATGANGLALLGMRTALRMGDVPAALKLAAAIPNNSPARQEPDLLWMIGSAHFLAHQYAEAEQPLLALFALRAATPTQRAAAAYGLCGVYQKTGNQVEQLRFALWHTKPEPAEFYSNTTGGVVDQSIYLAWSGYDLGSLLDSEASDESLRSFLEKYPNVEDVRKVKYALAVRLTRENQYDEAAQIYQDIRAIVRAPRTRELAALYKESQRSDLAPTQLHEAQYKLAEFLANNENRIYYNDTLWNGFQREALQSAEDFRLTRTERDALIQKERDVRDSQEEYWRAYKILSDLIRDEGKSPLGRKAAMLAIRCVRSINIDRFGRRDEIRKADIELSRWLSE